MSHHHHHHNYVYSDIKTRKILVFAIFLNILYVVVEATIGIFEDSLSLLSDAGHNLGDIFSLLLVLIGVRLSYVRPSKNYSYGLKKSTILISLLNAIILLVAVGAIVVESIHKFKYPSIIDGTTVSFTATVGIIVNGLTVILLMHSRQKDLNIRGALLHMVADTLVSIGVVISGVVMNFTGFYTIDPIMSLIIAIVILFATWNLLHDSLRLLIDGTPVGMDSAQILQAICNCSHVINAHHLHIWAISTTDCALTCHIIIDDFDNIEITKTEIKKMLFLKGISHVTLEAEARNSKCEDVSCSIISNTDCTIPA